MANKKLRQMGGNIQYVSAGEQYMDIPRWGVLYELTLRVAFTITSGGGAPTGPLYQTLARIIRNLSIIANGRDYIVNLPGETLAALAYIKNGRVPFGMSAALPSAPATPYNYVVYLPVTFYLPESVRPDDTGLNLGTPRIAGVPAQLKITWANSNCSDFFATPNGAALSNVSCEVAGLYETDPSPVFENGDDKGKPRFWLTRVLDQKVISLPSSNSKFPIIIDEGTGVFQRGLLLETLEAAVGVDTVLNNGNAELRVGSDVYGSLNAGFIKSDMANANQADPQAGVYHMPFQLFGSAKTLINTLNLPADLILYLDATKPVGVTNIAVTREGIRNLMAA